jgi:hypothetical protein
MHLKSRFGKKGTALVNHVGYENAAMASRISLIPKQIRREI